MLEQTFYSCVQMIDEQVFKRIYQKSYKKNCPTPLDCLRYITLYHYGFDNKIHMGELIVNHSITQQIISIFEELFCIQYPIQKMILVDAYDANDICSMEDNNTSCFNCRFIDGTNKLSNHSLGLAIDINPLYNPYVRAIGGVTSILPKNGIQYANRNVSCPYYIKKHDACYNIFTKYGFTWGGDWSNSKDYQHFEICL